MVFIKAEDMICATIGGILIGLATSLNLWSYGRITGNSGIFNTLIKFSHKDGFRWKFSFLSGLVTASYGLYLTTDKFGGWNTKHVQITLFDPIYTAIANLHVVGWIIGGLLVGIGTRMGNGCTSGHGVCGIPRFSIRSIVAVCTFMATGIGMATFRYNVPFLEETQSFGRDFEDVWEVIGGVLALVLLIVFLGYMAYVFRKEILPQDKFEMPISWLVGFIFGVGLVISGMCRRSKILGFLTLNENWDPSLMLVMVGAIGINLLTFYYIINKLGTPMLAPKL